MLFFGKPDFKFNFPTKMAICIPMSLSLVFVALLCHISRMFIIPLISVDTGLGLE